MFVYLCVSVYNYIRFECCLLIEMHEFHTSDGIP